MLMGLVSLYLVQVSQVYETIELDWLAKLAPFTTPTQLETVVIETAQSNGIQVELELELRCVSVMSEWQQMMAVSFG